MHDGSPLKSMQVRDDRPREGDHYQDAHEGSKDLTPKSSTRADLEERGEYNNNFIIIATVLTLPLLIEVLPSIFIYCYSWNLSTRCQ